MWMVDDRCDAGTQRRVSQARVDAPCPSVYSLMRLAMTNAMEKVGEAEEHVSGAGSRKE